MQLSDITKVIAHAKAVNPAKGEITSLCQDSRRVKSGSVFVAIQGSRLDGHDFIGEAIRANASACICERAVPELKNECHFIVEDTYAAFSMLAAEFYEHPSKAITCVGVTGTDGKTSTTTMIQNVLDAHGGAGMTSTVYYKYSGRKIPAERTTPDAVTLQALIRNMVSAGLKYAVIEVSSHALVQSRTADIDFKVGLLTNLSPEHLDYHSTLEEYRSAKKKLFEQLPEDATAVLNADDPSSDLFAQATKARVLRYGRGGDIQAEIISSELGRTVIAIKGLDMNVRIETLLTGRHNVQNVLATCCACRGLDVPVDTIANKLADISPVPGRLELVKNDLDRTVLIDYAHTARALRCVLEEIKPLGTGRLIVVFGCGGDRDSSKRPLMGKAAEEMADAVWVTSDNPRSEDPQSIIRQILSGMDNPGNVNVEPDREAAIRHALESAGPADTVIIAGKGHEKFQVVGDASIPFDDREVARRIASEIRNLSMKET